MVGFRSCCARGMKVMGVEPEESVAIVGIDRGLDIRVGYFPECMTALDQFDVITFNDSLEHLSNIGKFRKLLSFIRAFWQACDQYTN
jgi:2-polyprenyl-3-methyl-5-hydroxy-6-metoxy-1,4-benzoquinol methylase